MTGPRPDEPTRAILNIEEASRLLGVSTKTFAKVLRQGQIPGRKVGREWKFSRQALIDWVAAGRSRDFLEIDDTLEGEQAVADGAGAAPFARAESRPPRPVRPAQPHPRAGRTDREMSVEED